MNTIESIKGIGPKKAELLKNVGITTVEGLLYFFPSKYEYFQRFETVEDVSEEGNVCFFLEYNGGATKRYASKIGAFVQWRFSCGKKRVIFTWFNQPYIANSLVKGKKYLVKCKAELKGNTLMAVNPSFTGEDKACTDEIIPIYPKVNGISSNELSVFISRALESYSYTNDVIPNEIQKKYGFLSLKESLYAVHFPKNEEECIRGMRRFIFEEFFMFRLRQLLNVNNRAKTGASIEIPENCDEEFIKLLPYSLTSAQKNAINDVKRDLKSPAPMNRLIQGDVGSGKTAVAFAACFMAKGGGKQSVIMVPTEVLARQHMESFEKLFGKTMSATLLVGSMKANEKKEAKRRFACGETDVLIGTHAVLEEDVSSQRVGLVITDEQHRFGVRQRLNLKNKGKPVNMLVLTATPIPRTMSIVIYGDLDISVINELPEGRIPIKTYCVNSSMKQRIYAFILKEISAGHQVYIVCPLVESKQEGDSERASVKEFFADTAKNELKSARCDVIYGSMKAEEKEQAMKRFVQRKTDILISTTVIEVGVNVPNATVMLIENAEKFGLAQLHQLRGRVGRGNDRSYCILMSDTKNEVAISRLKTIASTNDGFVIAEQDMKLRGQGEYFGIRQHGAQLFRFGELPRDVELFAAAAEAIPHMEENYPATYKELLEKARILNNETVFN